MGEFSNMVRPAVSVAAEVAVSAEVEGGVRAGGSVGMLGEMRRYLVLSKLAEGGKTLARDDGGEVTRCERDRLASESVDVEPVGNLPRGKHGRRIEARGQL